MRFSKKHRLWKEVEFRAVFDRPLLSRDRYFKVFGKRNELPFCRLGLGVSRKCCRFASGRNRLKRVIRESFRLSGTMGAGERGLDFVVLPTTQAVGAENEMLFASLQRHWRNIRDSDAAEAQKGK